jgi:LPXTG-motif cell wall-anchored protein
MRRLDWRRNRQWSAGGAAHWRRRPFLRWPSAASARWLPPVTPAKVVPAKTLPRTGASGVGELLFGSMLLLGLGGAALVAARRRESGDHHVS